MPTTVTASPVRHFPDCQITVEGHAVRWLLRTNTPVTFDSLAGAADRLRAAGTVPPCGCAQLRLTHAENSLRLARASARAWAAKHPREEMHLRSLQHRVDTLLAQRDALRSAVSR